jgi:hypothetical protein
MNAKYRVAFRNSATSGWITEFKTLSYSDAVQYVAEHASEVVTTRHRLQARLKKKDGWHTIATFEPCYKYQGEE